jgi:hypothetical protein
MAEPVAAFNPRVVKQVRPRCTAPPPRVVVTILGATYTSAGSAPSDAEHIDVDLSLAHMVHPQWMVQRAEA